MQRRKENSSNFDNSKKRKVSSETEQKKKRRRTDYENEDDSEEAFEDIATDLAELTGAPENDIEATSIVSSEDYERPRRLTRSATRKNASSRAPVTTEPDDPEEEDDEDFETKPAPPPTSNVKKPATTRKKAPTKKNGRLLKREADQQGQLENLGNEITKVKSIIENLSQQQNDPSFVNAILSVVDDLINELSMEICFEVHKKLKTGRVCRKCETKWASKKSDTDIFGKSMNNYTPESFTCNNEGCNRVIAASRYAPHLEKCMGLNIRGSTRLRRNVVEKKSLRNQKGKQSDE